MTTGTNMPASLHERAAFSVDEFCAWAGISAATFYRETAAGRLTARKIGRKTVILRAECERWLQALPLADSKLGALL